MKTMLALFTAALMMAPHLASAGPQCTPEKVAGTYGFTISGTILPGNPSGLPEGPAVATGILVLDENGHMSGSETISFNGVIASGVQFDGTYQVTADCQLTLEDPGFFHNYGVVVDNANGMYVMSTDYGMIITITAKRLQTK